ncbi:MAG TPA: CapA family protein [Allosphingosinicella sp.]
MAARFLFPGEEEPRAPGYRLLIAGDVHHGDNYKNSGARIAAEKGYDYSFEKLRPLIGRADFALVNMETPATNRTVSPIVKHFLHRTNPDGGPPALARVGIDAVGLANNHSMDYGRPGLADTLRVLAANNIQVIGAGADLAAAERPLLLQIPATGAPVRHVAVFSLFEHRPEFEGANSYYAAAGRPGVAAIDPHRFGQLVKGWRDRYPDLFVVASAHWGRNYAWRTPQQATLGRGLIDAGADLVIGHHGHNFQEVERYGGKWILYGIGNFVFNSRGRFNQFGTLPPYGLGVELDFALAGSGGPLARLYPVLVDNLRTGYQPQIPAPPEAKAALTKLLERSEISLGRRGLALEQDNLGVHLRLSL